MIQRCAHILQLICKFLAEMCSVSFIFEKNVVSKHVNLNVKQYIILCITLQCRL